MSTARRVALITGAGDGIGQATAVAFAAAGYDLALLDLSADLLASTVTLLDADRAGEQGVVDVRVVDVIDEHAVGRAVEAVVARFGAVDALINIVGGSRPGKTAVQLSLTEWNQLLALNLTSTFLLCRAVIPHMELAGHGAVVNVSSGAGLRGMRANPGYCAAKGGIVALTRALAIDHGPNGVRVNAVAPGPVRTPLMRRNRTPDEIASMGSLSVSGRIGEPGELAAAILWLAGDGASYVMGQTLEVDGGPAAMI
jgi:NAD(P)-dependent dehydrogenase (short-subunit alcohol dehydrogenase family)